MFSLRGLRETQPARTVIPCTNKIQTTPTDYCDGTREAQGSRAGTRPRCVVCKHWDEPCPSFESDRLPHVRHRYLGSTWRRAGHTRNHFVPGSILLLQACACSRANSRQTPSTDHVLLPTHSQDVNTSPTIVVGLKMGAREEKTFQSLWTLTLGSSGSNRSVPLSRGLLNCLVAGLPGIARSPRGEDLRVTSSSSVLQVPDPKWRNYTYISKPACTRILCTFFRSCSSPYGSRA